MADSNRRDFLKQFGLGAAAVAVAGPGALASDDSVPAVDARKDAMLLPKALARGEDRILTFDVEKLPEGKKIELDILLEQVFQLGAVIRAEDGKNKLQALAFPKQNGEMKIYQLREGQEVDIKVFAKKDAKEPIAEDGKPLVVTYKQNEAPNYVKDIADKLKAPSKMVAFEMLDAAGWEFSQALKANKLGKGFEKTALNLDGVVLKKLEEEKAMKK